MPDAQAFWDRIAPRYARTPIKDEAAYEQKLEMTRRYLDPSMELLEVGCGTGGTAVRHSSYVGQILATDLSENMINIARERAAQAGVENVRFERAALNDVRGSAGPFDAVLALSLLHLLEDLDAALGQIRDLLRPGGLFVSSTACLGDGYGFFRYLGPPLRALRILPTINVFSEAELLQALGHAGFIIEERWKPAASGPGAVFLIARLQ